MLHSRLGCNSGCGEFYWSEWTYDPPDDCDPCDDLGNWVGPRCCWPRGWLALWQGFRGRRFAGGCGDEGCGGCSSGCEGSLGTGGTLLEGDVLEGVIPEGGTLQPGLMEFEESPIYYPRPASVSRTMGRTGSPSSSGTTRSCLKRR
ncbi:MAG: hypothetical protein FJ276_19505 [Planctomycetes bacterium]|nr:hypothetical protein [Planctomycetota bacterium]